MLTRRSALLGTAAAMSFAAPVAVAEYRGHPAAHTADADLMELVRTFHPAYRASQEAREAMEQARADAEAHPDCPCISDWPAWRAFMDAHEGPDRYDEFCASGERCGRTAQAIFAISPESLQGVTEKLKIVALAIEDGDLEAYQDFEDSDHQWMESVIRDLERLAGRAS